MNKTKKIVLISNDRVGKTMAGPGIRYYNLAHVLAEHFSVVLLVPDQCDLSDTKFKIKIYNSKKSSSSIAKHLDKTDYIISQSLRPPLLSKIKKNGIRYIADLYDPLTIEVLEYTVFDPPALRSRIFDFNYTTLNLQLDAADHILCASEKQKDFYLGMLSNRHLVNPISYEQSPDFSKYISVLPFGLSSDRPQTDNKKRLEEKFSGIQPTDKIIYWGGGVWNWFDALSAVKAIELIAKKRSDVKLFFLGLRHPNPKIKEMEMAAKTVAYAKDHDLTDKSVFFNYDWTPYEQRVDYMSRASIGISTHFNNLETRFSFRTRLLDYLWSDLPMVVTKGDALADMVEKFELGRTVDYESPEMIAEAILGVLDDSETYTRMKNNIHKVRSDFEWKNITTNLVDLINKDQISFTPLRLLPFMNNSYKFYRSGAKKKLLRK